jgi:hypothetical protein
MNEPDPNIPKSFQKQRFCAIVETVEPFSPERKALNKRLIQYIRQTHPTSYYFYYMFAAIVASKLVQAGRLGEMVAFEAETYRRGQVDFEDTYRFFRDGFIAFYDSIFPNATGPYVDEAKANMIKEKEDEVKAISSSKLS